MYGDFRCDGSRVYGIYWNSFAGICSAGDRCVYEEHGGRELWCVYHEVLLSVLLDACHPADSFRNDPRCGQDNGNDVRLFDFIMPLSDRLDLGKHGIQAQSGSADDGLSYILAGGSGADLALWMERKMDAKGGTGNQSSHFLKCGVSSRG